MIVIDHPKPRFSSSPKTYQVRTQRHFSYFRDARLPVTSFEELRDWTTLLYEYDKAWHVINPYIRTLEALLHTEVYFSMPRNSNAPLTDWHFAVITLTTSDENKFNAWYAENVNNVISLTSSVLADGYKLSATYDTNNTCFILTLSGTVNSNQNKNVSMSARSDDFYEALALLLFKHFVICGEGNWLDHTRKANWG